MNVNCQYARFIKQTYRTKLNNLRVTRNVHLLQLLDWQPNHVMFVRGRHFNVKMFANNHGSTQDIDLKNCYNIKVTSQVFQGVG